MPLIGSAFGTRFRARLGGAATGCALILLALSGCQDSSAPVPKEPESFLSRSPAAGWTIKDLGTLGGDSSVAYDLIGNHKVVGVSRTATGELHAFVWTAATQSMQDLGTLGGDFSVAYAVNGVDQIVGQSSTASGEFRAFLTTSTQPMTDLGTLGGDYSIALGINQLGEVVGLSRVPSGEMHAFKWTLTNGMVDLGTMGGDYSVGYGVDPFGDVVGYSRTPAGVLHAYRKTPGGQMVDLGVLPGGQESWAQDAATVGSLATGPTGPRYVAGYSEVRIPDPTTPSSEISGSLNRWIVIHAFRWTPTEGMVDLGAGGGLHSFGLGVNEFGDVVGQVVNIQNEDRAFFWDETNGFSNLGTLGGPTSFANAVSRCGYAAGGSEDAAGLMHAVLWTKPCPRTP